jgi:hypothetical protein
MKLVDPVESVEKYITTAMILSLDFLARVEPIIDLEFIQNPHFKIIARWCLEYFRKFQKEPGQNIQHFYELEKGNFDEALSDMLRLTLSSLSTQQLSLRTLNIDYIFEKCIKYFNERDLTIRLDRAIQLKSVGRIEDAWQIVTKKTDVGKAYARWGDVFTKEAVIETYTKKDDGLFSMPGVLGEMLGDFHRGWLVGILGGFKKGKTHYMMEMAIRALLARRRVAFISLEMPEAAIRDRIYRNIIGFGDTDSYIFPVFDCALNQINTCNRPERKNNVAIKKHKSDEVEYNAATHKDYIPCTYCRDNDIKDYELASWFYQDNVHIPTVSEIAKDVNDFAMMYGNNLKTRTYPRFSASVDDVYRDLRALELYEDFIPDVVVLDYANIMRGAQHSSQKDHKVIDEIWMSLSGLMAENKYLGITGAQGNRSSLKKVLQEEEDIADWVGILGHVDMFLALNQTPLEKRQGKIRFNVLEHRYKKFYPDQDVIVLQQLDTGQTYLDSEYSK